AHAGADIIVLPAGDYKLSITGPNEDKAATGDLDITDDLTIQGAGAATTTVDAQGLDRVFEITSPPLAITGVSQPNGQVVNISGLTVTGGNPGASGSVGNDGGGISNGSGTATLNLDHVVVTGNKTIAEYGGAGLGGGIDNEGTLAMTNCVVSDNQSAADGG